ncbi:CopG family antitoxin [Desulfothermobacter acidiphilus]|uniref:CopG family antitoxin n=1 Tax=Desulfothermobacter acidiphilus TaxID=1938353 RepID=UPI003F899397
MTKELPRFESEEEEARFWDTHNSLNYIESEEQVEIELAPELARELARRSETRRVALRLRVSQIEAAKEIARRKDIPYQRLLRSWIAEAIRRELGRQA